MVCVIATVFAAAGKEEELKAACLAMVPPTRLEPGCICYDVHQVNDAAGTIVFYENWKDMAAFEAHTETEHFKQFFEVVEKISAQEPDLKVASMISERA